MKKDFIRDYATEAFRFYARSGEPTYNQLRNKVIQSISDRELQKKAGNEVKNIDIYKPVEIILEEMDEIFREAKGELLDLIAVNDTIEELERTQSGDVKVKILKAVYFENSHANLKRNDISSRIDKVSLEVSISTSQIYRYLKDARNTFAKHRELRVS